MRHRSSRRWAAVLAAVSLAATAVAGAVPASAAAPFDHIANDTIWRDTAGNQIRAQGGNVFKNVEDGKWYWVGSRLPAAQDGGDLAKSINLYSSTDLESWTFEKSLVTQSDTPSALNVDLAPGADASDLRATSSWLGRPQLIRNPVTDTWIIWAEVGGKKTATKPDGTVVSLGNAQAVFTSDSLTGRYTYQGKHYTNRSNGDGTFTGGFTSGDRSVFVDGNNAYLVYVGDSALTRNVDLAIAPLSADWTRVGNPVWSMNNAAELGSRRYEAPGIVKVGSTYYLFASAMQGFNATQTSYQTTTSSGLTGWNGFKPVPSAPVPSVSDSFGTQFESIIPVVGASGTSYLYNGDRYSQYYPRDDSKADQRDQFPSGVGTNAWYPLTFESGVPRLHGATDVDVDAAAGTLRWNYIANGRFDQRQTNDPRGNHPLWTFTGTTRIETTGSAATKQQLVIGGTNFTGTAVQSLTLPAGTYELAVDYKSKNGLGQGSVSVSGAVDPVDPLDLTSPASAFTTRTLTFTVPSAGAVKVTAQASGATGRLELDNLSIWKQ